MIAGFTRGRPGINMATIPLSTLLDFLVQKSYHDLSVLAELLPRKSDIDRKIEIVQYAKRSRMFFVRLLALVKWASTADSLKRCAAVSEGVDQQTLLFVDTANQLATLARDTLTQACLPNFGLAAAIDVLTTGTYPRLPTCIRNRIVPSGPLSPDENLRVYGILEDVIRKRLIAQPLPPTIAHELTISRGCVVVTVPKEFQVTLTLLGDDLNLPWRLLKLKILTNTQIPGEPPLVHSAQKEAIHRLVQSRLYVPPSPLADMYNILHTFCMSLHLDVLHSQCLQLESQVCGGFVQVEEYLPGEVLRISYWRPFGSSHSLSAFLQQTQAFASPKLSITLRENPTSFVVDHTPALPPDVMKSVQVDQAGLSFSRLLSVCVQAHIKTKILTLFNSLKGTPFESRVEMFGPPYALRVDLSRGSDYVTICIDGRVGKVVMSVKPSLDRDRQVLQAVEELERSISTNHSALPENLHRLRMLLCHRHICQVASEQGLTHLSTIPLVTPLTTVPQYSVYIQHPLIDGIYMVVSPSVRHDRWTLDYRYFFLWTTSSAAGPAVTVTQPTLLHTVKSLMEVNMRDLVLSKIGCVPVSSKGVMLKRKLQQHGVSLPSAKRLCCQPVGIEDALVVSQQQLAIQHAKHQLHQMGVEQVVMYQEGAQGQVLRVLGFPPLSGTKHAQNLLSRNLQSCDIRLMPTGWVCTLCIDQNILFPAAISSGRNLILHTFEFPASDSISTHLVQLWMSMLTLLDPVLELTAFCTETLEGRSGNWRIASYNYQTLCLLYGPNMELGVEITGDKNDLAVTLNESNPHYLLGPHLQGLLNKSRSIPLLLQGLTATLSTVKVFHTLNTVHLKRQQPFIALSSRGPAHVSMLAFGVYNLDFGIHSNGSVVISDGGTKAAGDTSSCPINPGVYIQGFLKHYLSVSDGGTADSMETASSSFTVEESAPKPNPILAPSPRPIASAMVAQNIASPRPLSVGVAWSPASPSIPNLPSVPSPRTPRVYASPESTEVPVGWSFCLTHEQFTDLLRVNEEDGGECPLTHCLGCLSLFYQFLTTDQNDKQVQNIRHKSRDHGSATLQMETLQVTLTLDPVTYRSIELELKPTQDYTWMPPELECLTKFFKTQIVQTPYSRNNLIAFVRLLSVPTSVLRGCVRIMQIQMTPPPDVHWHVKLCLTIPEGLGAPEVAQTGLPAVAYKGKLLLIVLLQSVTMMGYEVIVPLLHDPQNNSTRIASIAPPKPHAPREAIMRNIEQVLKTALQEFQASHTAGQQMESSLFSCVKAIISSKLYDTV